MDCNDCGETISEASQRDDVCRHCFETRKALVTGKLGLNSDQILNVQQAMQRRDGSAKHVLEELLQPHD